MSDPRDSGKRQQIDVLMPQVYEELRRIAARYLKQERTNHTLQPTALVNEVFLKFDRQARLDVVGRTHFVALAATAMRQILIDYAKRKKSAKRGGGALVITLDEAASLSEANSEAILDLEAALEKLERLDPTEARIVELKFFGGLTEAEIASELGMSDRWVRDQWAHARAWLRRELADPS
jgi:RNA polymerase sigma factor (TIGR02999 family)